MRRASSRANDQLSRGIVRGRAASPSRTSSTAFGLSRSSLGYLIAVVDGLKGFPEAIATVFPLTTVQTCIIHLIRNSLAFVSWKDRKLIMPDLKAIYRAETADTAAAGVDLLEDRQVPMLRTAPTEPGREVAPISATDWGLIACRDCEVILY
jgi:hypothetical protein